MDARPTCGHYRSRRGLKSTPAPGQRRGQVHGIVTLTSSMKMPPPPPAELVSSVSVAALPSAMNVRL
jgi:hypothetical protein